MPYVTAPTLLAALAKEPLLDELPEETAEQLVDRILALGVEEVPTRFERQEVIVG